MMMSSFRIRIHKWAPIKLLRISIYVAENNYLFLKQHSAFINGCTLKTRNYNTENSVEELLHSGQKDKIEVGGFKINYIKAGHGPHVVFCFPGILGSMRVQLQHQILKFDRNMFTFYSWDQPGYGKSRQPRIFTDDSLQEDAHFAVQLMKIFGEDKFSVMGWSGGGCSALLMAIQYPQIVQKLIVWGAFSYVNKKDAENFKRFADSGGGGRMKDVLVEEYGEEFFLTHFSLWMNLFARIYTHRGGELCAKQLSNIKCPSLIIHGTKDNLIFPEQGDFLHRNIRGSKLHVWENGKHNVNLRYPDEFNKIVQDFLLE